MTARAESIMNTVKTTLTGLTTTGNNVQRGQIYRHEPANLPAAAIFMGDDEPLADLQTGLIDWQLLVRIETTTQLAANYETLDNTLETQINLMREEVHAALMADHTLGLSYVIDIEPAGASSPILSGEGDKATASQLLEYIVTYRTSRADIGA